MTATDASTQHAPVDAVVERLNDPTVAAALVTLLDNAELLSTLVLGLSGLVERSETIMDTVAEGVQEFKAAADDGDGLPSLGEVASVTGTLAASNDTITKVLDSSMVEPATIDLLSMLSDAANEGVASAQARDARLGIRETVRALRDPDVQRGLGMAIEISRALGRRLQT